MAGLATLSKHIPATDQQGLPVLIFAIESVTGIPKQDPTDEDHDYVWVIAHDGSISVRTSDTVTVDWQFVTEDEATTPNEPEGVSGQVPDPD